MEKKVIHTTIVPWILGKGSKTPEEAKFFITKKKNLDTKYENKPLTENECLSTSIGEKVFNNDQNYEMTLNDNLIILAKPNGISENKTIIMLDKTLETFKSSTIDEILIKVNTTMAVCGAEKGIYFMQKLNKKICYDFDVKIWENILKEIKSWAKYL